MFFEKVKKVYTNTSVKRKQLKNYVFQNYELFHLALTHNFTVGIKTAQKFMLKKFMRKKLLI
jgi:hypothetical protein